MAKYFCSFKWYPKTSDGFGNNIVDGINKIKSIDDIRFVQDLIAERALKEDPALINFKVMITNFIKL